MVKSVRTGAPLTVAATVTCSPGVNAPSGRKLAPVPVE
jgi:hypothetical protein